MAMDSLVLENLLLDKIVSFWIELCPSKKNITTTKTMPYLRIPRSDAGQLHLLSTTLKTAASDATTGKKYLPADLLEKITTFLNDQPAATAGAAPTIGFANLLAQRATLEGDVTRETAESQLAEAALDTFISDYIVVLARRTRRMKHNVAVLDYHKLDHSGNVPVTSSREARRIVASQLIAGDAAAITAGFPAMVNPSAAELQTHLDAAVTEADDIIPADRALQDIIEKIRIARIPAAELVQEVIEELRHATRRNKPSTAREIMRSYGCAFETLPGEIPDSGDVATAAPLTPPTPDAL